MEPDSAVVAIQVMNSLTFNRTERSAQTRDVDLLLRAGWDRDAFRVLFERHASSVYRYAASRVGPDTAADVVADTFAIAFEQRARFAQDATSALPWLLGIATNRIRRHRRIERAWLRDDAAPTIAVEDFSHEAHKRADAAAQRLRVIEAVRGLGRHEREVLLLFALGGLSYEEVAQALDIAVGTVRSRLSRARRKMQDLLEDFHD